MHSRKMPDYHCTTLLFKKLHDLKVAVSKIDAYADLAKQPWIGRKDIKGAALEAEVAMEWVLSLSQPRYNREIEEHFVDFELLRGSIANYYKHKDDSWFTMGVKEAIIW